MMARRKKKSRAPLVGGLAAIGVLLWLFRGDLGLGDGFGLGQKEGEPAAESAADAAAGAAPASADAAAAAEPAPPCEMRLDATGLHMADRVVSLEVAVEACKVSGKAALEVTGDANYGELEKVRKALEDAGVTVLTPAP